MNMPDFNIFDVGGWFCSLIQYLSWSFCNGACDLINEMLGTVSGGKMDIFTLPLDGDALHKVYDVSVSVLHNVAMPVAYAFLGLLVAIELFDCVKGMRAGTARLGGSDQLIACIIKIMIVKILIDNCQGLFQAIYDLTCNISHGIEKFAGAAGGDVAMPKDAFLSLIKDAPNSDLFLFIIMIVVMFVAVIVIFIAVVIIQVVALTRYLEIFICISFAALPIILFLNQHVKQQALVFLKVYVAACLQGPVLVLLLKFIFPLFAAVATILGTVVSGGHSTILQTLLSCAAPLAMCFSIVVMVQRSRDYANSIVGGS